MRNVSHARDAAGRIQSGKITFIYVLSTNGRVTAPVIVRSSNPLLNAPLLKDFQNWTTTPARLDGKAVPVIMDGEWTLTRPPPAKRQFGYYDAMAVDAKGVTHRATEDPDGFELWYDDIVKDVQPSYSPNNGVGTGVFRLILNVDTGLVRDVITLKSAGNPKLDNIARTALRQWRWVPGRWRSIDLPFTFRNASPYDPTGGEHFPIPVSVFPSGITR